MRARHEMTPAIEEIVFLGIVAAKVAVALSCIV
jgi:hypothetical protein